MKAPFPYFGGKSAIADAVWDALGNPAHYIEPFFGSGAVLLNRPNYKPGMIESICDKDGYVANVWRALQSDPDAVAKVCDWPVNHADLSARKKALLRRGDDLLQKLIADEKYYDAELAGYWIWAASCWIGSGLTYIGQIPHISDGGKGVHAIGQRPHVGDGGNGVQEPYNTNLYVWFRQLSERLRYVRVVCGDWTRVTGGFWQNNLGTCGIFFDPPYGHDQGRDNEIYHIEEDVTKDVEAWCLHRANEKDYRVVVAGYEGEYKHLEATGWTKKEWKAIGGYASQGDGNGKENAKRERLWLSPHCLGVKGLF